MAQNKVTIAERVRMNAIAGILFVLAGDAIILYAIFNDKSGTMGATLTGLYCVIAVCFGLYYMACFINKRLTVSDEGVKYVNWIGKTTDYEWKDVVVEHLAGRNAKFIFHLAGKKVSFYGYSINALALHEYLMENDRYDNDTKRREAEAREAEEERVRQMQRKAQADDSDWDDDDDWDD